MERPLASVIVSPVTMVASVTERPVTIPDSPLLAPGFDPGASRAESIALTFGKSLDFGKHPEIRSIVVTTFIAHENPDPSSGHDRIAMPQTLVVHKVDRGVRMHDMVCLIGKTHLPMRQMVCLISKDHLPACCEPMLTETMPV